MRPNTAASASPALRVIIMIGAGDKAFVAGGDIRYMLSATPAQAVVISQAVKTLHETIRRYPRPIVAAINGHCLGGGLELAMACDIRIAARTAGFGLPEIRLGNMPGGGGTARLARLVGSAAARALCLTGQAIIAERAYSLGLLYDVVEPVEVMPAAKRLATELVEFSEFALGQL